MIDHGQGREVLHIKKYPNRRYYDTSRSCHVTLHHVHDLILSGKDVCITDSKTDEDITNLVLIQILLEKDQPKLDVFPSSIFHMMIRSNRQVLHGYVEQFVGPMMQMIASSRKQFEEYMRGAAGSAFMTPLDWANRMMELFAQSPTPPSPDPTPPPPDPEWDEPVPERAPGATRPTSVSDPDPKDASSIEDLRAEAAALVRRIEQLGQQPDGDASESSPTDQAPG